MKNLVKMSEVAVNVNNTLATLESLRVKRASVTGVIESSVKAIDKASKEAKEAIAKSLKALDVVEACEVASNLSASPYKADDATRQRMARRRGWLVKALELSFPNYDIINNRGNLTAQYIGDSKEREAREIFARLAELSRMGITLDSTVEEIKAKLGSVTVAVETSDNLPTVQDMLGEIAKTIAGQKAETKKVKQA